MISTAGVDAVESRGERGGGLVETGEVEDYWSPLAEIRYGHDYAEDPWAGSRRMMHRYEDCNTRVVTTSTTAQRKSPGKMKSPLSVRGGSGERGGCGEEGGVEGKEQRAESSDRPP